MVAVCTVGAPLLLATAARAAASVAAAALALRSWRRFADAAAARGVWWLLVERVLKRIAGASPATSACGSTVSSAICAAGDTSAAAAEEEEEEEEEAMAKVGIGVFWSKLESDPIASGLVATRSFDCLLGRSLYLCTDTGRTFSSVCAVCLSVSRCCEPAEWCVAAAAEEEAAAPTLLSANQSVESDIKAGYWATICAHVSRRLRFSCMLTHFCFGAAMFEKLHSFSSGCSFSMTAPSSSKGALVPKEKQNQQTKTAVNKANCTLPLSALLQHFGALTTALVCTTHTSHTYTPRCLSTAQDQRPPQPHTKPPTDTQPKQTTCLIWMSTRLSTSCWT